MTENLSALTEDVKKFIQKAAATVGLYEEEIFSIDCWQEFPDNGIESPIEQMFYVAFKAACKILNCAPETGLSCQIRPQQKIGKYRVDFEVCQIHWEKKETRTKAIVECDGHNFHDRSEPERRYEKQRDRFLQTEGWKIFHFTGKEIKDNPFSCAVEVISYLTTDNYEVARAQVSDFER